MKKRGASELVAWVLIIGFSIALGVIVTQWLKDQATKSAEIVTKDIEKDLRCGDVSINAFFSSPCTGIDVTNKGYHKIVSIKVRNPYDVQELSIDLRPGSTSTISPQGIQTGMSVDLIPVIEGENERLGCIDRRIILQC